MHHPLVPLVPLVPLARSVVQRLGVAQVATRPSLHCPHRHCSRTSAPHVPTVSSKAGAPSSTRPPTVDADASVPCQRDLSRQLAALTRAGDAEEAVRCLRRALVHLRQEAATAQPVHFPWSSLATTLYICESRDEAEATAQGLALVEEVRRLFPLLAWEEENVLSVLLRLHAAAGHVQDSQQIFTFLLHRGQLKSRGASAFLRLLCRTGDLSLAAPVWQTCVQRSIALSMADYEALGMLCVAEREPVSTLHTLLRTLADDFASVSLRLCEAVVEPWMAQGAGPHRAGVAATRRVPLAASPPPLLTPQTQAQALLLPACPTLPPLTRPQTLCPQCGTVMPPFALSAAQRLSLLANLLDKVVAPRCQSNARARRAWEHWLRFLHASGNGGPTAYDILIDGANVGYYGLSARHDGATVHAPKTTTACNSDGARPRSGPARPRPSTASAAVDLALIDEAVRVAMTGYGFRRPLIFLHERHVEPHNLPTGSGQAVVQRWRDLGMLYCVPRGVNDDWCWLHAALQLGLCREAEEARGRQMPLCVVTNDEMRDHDFQLLHAAYFARWRAQHQVRFRCRWTPTTDGGPAALRRELVWTSPPSFEVAVQEDAGGWHIPITQSGEGHGAAANRDSHVLHDGDSAFHQTWLCVRSDHMQWCAGSGSTQPNPERDTHTA